MDHFLHKNLPISCGLITQRSDLRIFTVQFLLDFVWHFRTPVGLLWCFNRDPKKRTTVQEASAWAEATADSPPKTWMFFQFSVHQKPETQRPWNRRTTPTASKASWLCPHSKSTIQWKCSMKIHMLREMMSFLRPMKPMITIPSMVTEV